MSITPGSDYVVTGYSWPNPSHITYSIAPDGVFWDHGTNNLNASFNAKFGTSGIWERQFALALATWESVANINIVPVSDGPYDLNTLGQAQGDPRFGDIRFGGYAFLDTTITLAQTYFPPPQGSTAAGDVELNTSMNFNIGSTYDLYSVVLHETGHSLGLDEAPNPAEVMAIDYGGLRTGLQPGDIAGIQAIYGARTLDSYQSRGIGVSLAAPIDLSTNLAASSHTVVSGVSLSSIGSTEYYSFVAPSYASGTLQVTAAASNISMLSPQVSIYNASGALLSRANNPSAWSDNVTASIPAVVPGQRVLHGRDGRHGDLLRRWRLPARGLDAAELTVEPACASSNAHSNADAQADAHSSTSADRLAPSGDEHKSTNGDPSRSGHADDPSRSEIQLSINGRVL